MKWFRRAAWLLVAWAGVCAALWLVLPLWLKPEIEKQASAVLGREVRVEQLDIRPWALEVELRGVRVQGASSGDPALLTVDAVEVNADLRSFWERAPVVTAAVVRAPKLRLTRIADGRYDIDDLLEKFSQPSTQSSHEPARFALYNLQLVGGEIDVDDRPVKQLQQVRELSLSLPFLSNLPTYVDVKVEPRLQFLLNGSAFDSGAQTVPFAKQRSALVEFNLAPTDLTPYVGYIPNHLPVRLQSGVLQASLSLHLEMPVDASPRMQLKGDVQTKNIALTDASASPLLAWQQVDLKLLDVRPLEWQIHLGPLEIEGLNLDFSRSRDGPWNWMTLGPAKQPATQQATVPSPAPAAASAAKSVNKTPNAWRVSLKSLGLKNSMLNISDAAVKPVARLQVRLPEFGVGSWAWPLVAGVGAATEPASANPAPTDVHMLATLEAAKESGTATPVHGTLRVNGRLSGAAFDARLEMQDLPLQLLEPYLNEVLQPRLAARLSAKAQLGGRIPLDAGDAPASWTIKQGEVSVSDFRLTAPASGKRTRSVSASPALLSFEGLSLSGLVADSSTRRINLGEIVLTQPKTSVTRDKSGVWNAEKWLVQKNEPHQDKNSAVKQEPTALEAPWQVQLAQFQLKGGELDWVDAAARDDDRAPR